MQYTVSYEVVKKLKISVDFLNIFLSFAQNIDYVLEQK